MANKLQNWHLNRVDLTIMDLALIEDLGIPYQDVTTQLLFSEIKQFTSAKIISKASNPIIVCGLRVIRSLISKLDPKAEIFSNYQDGEVLLAGEILLLLHAYPETLLMIERILLNFLQRLCAIATTTTKYVETIKHTKTKILDTRKTIPGFRHLEKYAVQCGGGVNHRMGLYDAVMIKDTHIDMLGGMQTALNKLPDDILMQFPVIVEVRTIDELKIVLDQASHKVSRVLLDNMSEELITKCVELCEGKVPTEASGNISLDNIKTIAKCGVDFASIGKLTHSPDHVDLSMQCDF